MGYRAAAGDVAEFGGATITPECNCRPRPAINLQRIRSFDPLAMFHDDIDPLQERHLL